MIKRAMIAGLASTGVDVADLRVIPAAVARHLLKAEGFAAGFHVGVSPNDPEAIRIQFFEAPGIEMSAAMQKEVEKHFTRGELRRVAAARSAASSYPARVSESYASDLLSTIDVDTVRARRLPHRRRLRLLRRVLRPAARARAARRRGGRGARLPAPTATAERATFATSIGQAKRLVSAMSADLGASSTAPASASSSSTSRRARFRSRRRFCSTCA